MRPIAVLLALLLGFSASTYAADLEPLVTKGPALPPEQPVAPIVAPFLVLIPIGLIVACATVICKEEKVTPVSPGG
jgi:hypothetical protein